MFISKGSGLDNGYQQLETLSQQRIYDPSHQRLAIIDAGSNSFRLIVVEYQPGLSFRVVDEVREAVRLSEGMAEDNILRREAMDRAIRVLQIYAAFCESNDIIDIITVGTSAIRDAHNSAYFLKRVANEAGINIRVLSGEEEAYYAYLAAVNSTTIDNGLVVDLGGGSLELVRVEDRKPVDKISLPLGAVRVTEQFLKGDPPSAKQVRRLREHVAAQLAALDWFTCDSTMQVVGEGGTLRLLGRLLQKQKNYPIDELHGYDMQLDELDSLVATLQGLTVDGRNKLPGMKADRADISLGGAVVVGEALRASANTTMTVCSQGVREGLFYEQFLSAKNGLPIFRSVRESSVLNLAHLYRFQEQHAHHIAHLTGLMFDQLPPNYHICSEHDRELLWAASILHDIGTTVDYSDHHKHSFYLILNAGLPGYTHRETVMIALLARYHRKGTPTLNGMDAVMLEGDEKRLVQLAALLRVAEQLDRSRDGVVKNIVLRIDGDRALMELVFSGDEQVALWAVDHHRDIFEAAFGLRLLIIPIPEEEGNDHHV